MGLSANRIALELFLGAVGVGPAPPPEAVRCTLQDLPKLAEQPLPLDTLAIELEVAKELFISGSFFSPHSLEPTHPERCVSALRWVLQEMRVWTPKVAHASLRLRILLAALSAFNTEHARFELVFSNWQATPLGEGLLELLEHVALRQHPTDAQGNTLEDEIRGAAQDGDFERLKLLMRQLDLRLTGDIRLAIHLLWRMQPDLLSSIISKKQDAIFSYAVQMVLREQSPNFALSVGDVTYKFFSAVAVAGLRPESAPSGSVDVFRKLLLQVASTPAWGSWLRVFYKHPQGNSVSEAALSGALAKLQARHWADFVAAVQLWTYAGTAVPVAKILIDFYKEVGDPVAHEMWSLAFQRWDQWDYGRVEHNTHMFAPSACSFDFPVAMHYAQLQRPEVKAEEQRLVDAIESVELVWFSSVSELITRRNFLLSRLRLVRHGLALASAASAEPLPPPVRPDGEYAAARYRYLA